MSFEKKQWRANDDLTEKEMNDLEGRVDYGFSSVNAEFESMGDKINKLTHVIRTDTPAQTGWQGAKQVEIPSDFRGNFAVITATVINDNNVLMVLDYLSARPHRSMQTVTLELRTTETWATNRECTIVILKTK